MPAHNAAIVPETKLNGDTEPTKNPSNPPKNADKVPKYIPRIIPISGAIIAAAVTAFPGNPIIGEIGIKQKITYRAVKQIAKAISFVVNFLLRGIFAILLYVSGNLIIWHPL
jgi:hypothetical protein